MEQRCVEHLVPWLNRQIVQILRLLYFINVKMVYTFESLKCNASLFSVNLSTCSLSFNFFMSPAGPLSTEEMVKAQ